MRKNLQTPSKHRASGKKRWIKWTVICALTIIPSLAFMFGYKIISAGTNISTTEQSILGQLKDLLFGSGETLKGEDENRINILLLGVGGDDHSGADLADTIMIASVRPEDNSVALLSIPRDLYVNMPGREYYTKINAVHAYGEIRHNNQGPALMKETVKEVTGQDMHYYARLDFDAFKHIIDAVGGLNIEIENSFYDYWHKISFPAGTEKMNGERALAYVRARYVEGPEAGDFKRAARQQQVLLALREKVFSVNTALDFRAVNSILNSLSDNIQTDMKLWEMRRFYELSRMVDPAEVHTKVLSTGPNGALVGSTEILGGAPASVLHPRAGNFSEIHSLASNIFSSTPKKKHNTQEQEQEEIIERAPTPSPETTPIPASSITIEIRNGTTITGLAARTRQTMTTQGYDVSSIGNATNQNREHTHVYTLTEAAQEHGQAVSQHLGGANVRQTLPAEEGTTNADILIILGSDAN